MVCLHRNIIPEGRQSANPGAGQGVRHAGIPRYHKLIIAHAVFMVIPFLFLIPISLFFARYRKHAEPRQAIQWHFILNTATIVFITIGFILAYFAVDKGTWGSNPHHIIGVTIYAGVIVQACFGVLLRKREEKKIRKLGEVGLRGMVSIDPTWAKETLKVFRVARVGLTKLYFPRCMLGLAVASTSSGSHRSRSDSTSTERHWFSSSSTEPWFSSRLDAGSFLNMSTDADSLGTRSPCRAVFAEARLGAT